MGWRTPRGDRRSFGGGQTHHYGWLEPTPEAPAPESAPEQAGQTRIRSSAKEAEIKQARQAGATAAQITALLASLERLAQELGSETKLDWSVRYEAGQRSLCLRWRMLRNDGAGDPPAWQTERFGPNSSGNTSASAKARAAATEQQRRGFG